MIRLFASALSLATLLAFAAPALADDDCGNVDRQGTCVDSKTLVWCNHGELETQVCPQGEVCAVHDAFNGAAGCIGTEQTDCGHVTEAGECAGEDRVVVWCDANLVRARRCDEGTICHWVDDEAWFDCVPTSLVAESSSPADDNLTDDNETLQEPDAEAGDPHKPGAEFTGSPVPAVEKGGAEPKADLASSGGAGCAGGPAGGGLFGLLTSAALLLRRRRQAAP
ncbi:MAG: hypothetical protein CSA66_03275 [Proteobacteria bacterium]|nr:MAG: hypothetical protein CSA66_03275 [Pseudomonadota bacterium]